MHAVSKSHSLRDVQCNSKLIRFIYEPINNIYINCFGSEIDALSLYQRDKILLIVLRDLEFPLCIYSKHDRIFHYSEFQYEENQVPHIKTTPCGI